MMNLTETLKFLAEGNAYYGMLNTPEGIRLTIPVLDSDGRRREIVIQFDLDGQSVSLTELPLVN